MRLYLSASFCFIKAISWIPFLHGPVPTKHCSLCRKTMTSWKQQSSGSWPSLIWRDSKLEIHKILSAGSLKQSYWEVVQPPCHRGTDSTSRSRVRNRSWGYLLKTSILCQKEWRWHWLDHQFNKSCATALSAGTYFSWKISSFFLHLLLPHLLLPFRLKENQTAKPYLFNKGKNKFHLNITWCLSFTKGILPRSCFTSAHSLVQPYPLLCMQTQHYNSTGLVDDRDLTQPAWVGYFALHLLFLFMLTEQNPHLDMIYHVTVMSDNHTHFCSQK